MSAQRDVDSTLEDLEFLDSTGVGATDAAARTGFPSAQAMEKWLERRDLYDLCLRFKHRDPEGTHLSGTDRKERRLTSAPSQQGDTLARLLANGDASTRARTRNKAAKVRSLLDELRDTLNAEAEEDTQRESARKEIERLERELATAKARLRGGSSTQLDVDSSVSAADLRAWAARNGIECPPVGRVPNAVREAYEAAESDGAA